MLVTAQDSIWRHVPNDLNKQQHRCENVKPRTHILLTYLLKESFGELRRWNMRSKLQLLLVTRTVTSYYVVHKRWTNFEIQRLYTHAAEDLKRLCCYAVCLSTPFVMLRWVILPLSLRSKSSRKVDCLTLNVKAVRSLQT